MAKRQTDKEWQERNPDKAKNYTQKYLEGKERVLIILNEATLAKIDRVKPSEQRYSDWVRKLIKDWEDAHGDL